MSEKRPHAEIRFYVEHPLAAGQSVPLSRDRARDLFGAKRLVAGDTVLLFDGHSGEWRAEVAEAAKHGGTLICRARTRPLQMPPDLWLLFAPIEKSRNDFIAEKATELGVARICPVITDFSTAGRARRHRLQTRAIETAEQCGGTYVPEVAKLARLDKMLADWPVDRHLMFCDESIAGRSSSLSALFADANDDVRKDGRVSPFAILIGPRGGFSGAERDRLRALPFAHPVSLGPRILRADTAAVVAVTLWQATLGDWSCR